MRTIHASLLALACGLAIATPPTSDGPYDGHHHHGPPHDHEHGPPDVVTETMINTSTIWMTSQVCPSNKMNCPEDEKMLRSSCVTKTTTVLASTTVQVPITPTSATSMPAPPSSTRIITNEAIVEPTSTLPIVSSKKKTGPLPLTRDASGACYFGNGRTDCPHVSHPTSTPAGVAAPSTKSAGSTAVIPLGATTDTRVPGVASPSSTRSSAFALTGAPGSSVQDLGTGVGIGNPAGQSSGTPAPITGSPPVEGSVASVPSSNPADPSTFLRPSVGVAPASAPAGESSTPVAVGSSVTNGQTISASGRRTLDVVGSLVGVAPGNTVIGGTTTAVAGGFSVINGATVPITAGNTLVSVVPLVGVGPGSIVSGGQTVAVSGGSSVIGGTTMLAPVGNNAASAVPLVGVAPGSTVIGGTTIAVAGGSSVISGSTIPVPAASTPIPASSIASGTSAPQPSMPSGSAPGVASSGSAVSSNASRPSASQSLASSGSASATVSNASAQSNNSAPPSSNVQSASNAASTILGSSRSVLASVPASVLASSAAAVSSNSARPASSTQSASSATSPGSGLSSSAGGSSRSSAPAGVASNASSAQASGPSSSNGPTSRQSGTASSASRQGSSGLSGSSSSSPPSRPSIPPSTGATPSSPVAPRTSSTPSRPSSASGVRDTSSSPISSSLSMTSSVTSISSSAPANASIEWPTMIMPQNFWDLPQQQQVIGCPNTDAPCCIKLPKKTLTSTAVISYAPITTFVWVLEGDGEYKTAGYWNLKQAAGGPMQVCSWESNMRARQKQTVLSIPPRNLTAFGFSDLCSRPQDFLATQTIDPCDQAKPLPPRITASMGKYEMWQQPFGMKKENPAPDPKAVTVAACGNDTKWIVQPQPLQSFSCGVPPVTVAAAPSAAALACVQGASSCPGGDRNSEEDGGGSDDGDDDDDNPDLSLLFGWCKKKGLFPFGVPILFLSALECFCGIFGCDGGCGFIGCRTLCGLLDAVPVVGKVLDPFGLCDPLCQPPCGYGGGPRWPKLEPTPTPTPPKTSPPNSRPTSSNSKSTSESSCSEQTATITHVSCFTGTATQTCSEVGRSTITGCTVKNSATTDHCSLSTATKATIFCASSGTSGSCISPTATSSTVVSGCELSVTTATSFGPSCPMMTMEPDEFVEQFAEGEMGYPPTYGGPDPACEDAKKAEFDIPFESVLKPQIEDFCDNPGFWLEIPGGPQPGATEPTFFSAVEHHCSINDTSTILGLSAASTTDCLNIKFTKADCMQQMEKIANKCVSDKNKNDRIAGQVFDQKCWAYQITAYDWPASNTIKIPKCAVGKPKPDGPLPNADNADAWKFQFGIQWNQADYEKNAQDKVEVAIYGGASNADLNSCKNYWSQNDDAERPNYGNVKRKFDLGTKVQLNGRVKDLVENPNIAEMALPFDVRVSPTGGIQGTGMWPRIGSSLSMNGSCVQACSLQRDKDHNEALYTRCTAAKNECDVIKKLGNFAPGTLLIDYRCEKVDRKKISCSAPNGKQKDSEVGANTFMPLFSCEMKFGGSGPKPMNPVPPPSSTTGPKTLATPTKGKDSFKDLNFALVYHYTVGDTELDKGSGHIQVFGYKHAERKLNCDFFDEKPELGGYGYIEHTLNGTQGSIWKKGDKLGAFIDANNGMPQPKVDRLPLINDKSLEYPGNECARRCDFIRSARDGPSVGKNGPYEYWMECLQPNDGCVDQVPKDSAPAENHFYAFRCKDVKAEKLECQANKRNIFVPVMVCTPDDKESGWRTSTLLDKPRIEEPPKPPPVDPSKVRWSFRNADFHLVHQWSESERKDTEAGGMMQLYAVDSTSPNEGKPECTLFDNSNVGKDYGFIEFPLNTVHDWNKKDRKMTVDMLVEANKKAEQMPYPDLMPKNGMTPGSLKWEKNGCIKACRFQKRTEIGFDKKSYYLVVCVHADRNACLELRTAEEDARWHFEYRCEMADLKVRNCGTDKHNYFMPLVSCYGNGKDSKVALWSEGQ